jgi:hypothetical protein
LKGFEGDEVTVKEHVKRFHDLQLSAGVTSEHGG